MESKWEVLLKQLEEVKHPFSDPDIWSNKQLQEFESQTGLIFPQDYKDFCQTFATVGLGNYVRVYCPNLNFSNFLIDNLKNDLNNNYLPNLSQDDVAALEELLNSAFVFADDEIANVFFGI